MHHLYESRQNSLCFQNLTDFYYKEISSKIKYDKVVLAPMYYAKMLYYNKLFFRVIEKNEVYARGGEYIVDEQTSVGFAIYTDELIEKIGKS